MSFLQRTFHTQAPAAVLLIRLMVGGVFLSEGLQKFLLPVTRGIGRFEQVGIPIPGLTSPFVGAVEVVFGLLILFGILTRLATIPLLINMAVAIVTTKLPLLYQHGFWDMLHESRTDFWHGDGIAISFMGGRWTDFGGSFLRGAKSHLVLRLIKPRAPASGWQPSR